MPLSSEDIKTRIDGDPDFVNIKRFSFSLKRLLERYPEGTPTNVICQALMMDEEELELLYQKILDKLRMVLK